MFEWTGREDPFKIHATALMLDRLSKVKSKDLKLSVVEG